MNQINYGHMQYLAGPNQLFFLKLQIGSLIAFHFRQKGFCNKMKADNLYLEVCKLSE